MADKIMRLVGNGRFVEQVDDENIFINLNRIVLKVDLNEFRMIERMLENAMRVICNGNLKKREIIARSKIGDVYYSGDGVYLVRIFNIIVNVCYKMLVNLTEICAESIEKIIKTDENRKEIMQVKNLNNIDEILYHISKKIFGQESY